MGYATFPAGSAGGQGDRIIVGHKAIGGRNNDYGFYNQGRTLVREVGHYLGLFHTSDLEGDGTNTFMRGDLIVDTPAQLYADTGTACPITVPGLVNHRPYNCSVAATNAAETSAAAPVVVGVSRPPSVPETPIISRL